MKQEVCLNHFWCIPQAAASRKTTHVIVPFANEITCFFHLTSFLFGNLIDKLRLFRHEHLAGILSKMRKVASYMQENNTQHLLLMIKFKLLCEIPDFQKIVSNTVSSTASQYLKTFLMRLVVMLMHLSSLILDNKIWQLL